MRGCWDFAGGSDVVIELLGPRCFLYVFLWILPVGEGSVYVFVWEFLSWFMSLRCGIGLQKY